MFTISRSLPVNDRNNPEQVILTRDQVWQGLVFKAENAVPFVPGMTACEVRERSGQQLVRECVYKGDRLRERVTFHPPRAVDFERLSGNVRGTIRNEIEEDENGALHLCFTFSLAVQGIAHNSPEEHAYATAMEGDYVRAIGATLTTIRQLVAEGKLPHNHTADSLQQREESGMFSEQEIAYLKSQRLARLATVSQKLQPDVSPVGFEFDGESFYIGGLNNPATLKYRNVARGNTKVALVVDDLESIDPWRPRFIKIHGRADIVTRKGQFGESPYIRVTPHVKWSMGIDAPAFQGGKPVIKKTTR